MPALSEEIQKLSGEWLALDRNEKTRQEIQKLVDENNEAELKKILGKRMAFGTAGLRGRMGAGYACMNDLTVLQASQGLCAYVEQSVADCKNRGIVIGYDGRYNSKTFAHIAAAVFLTRGFKVFLYSRLVPTPFVPYAITLKKCAAGIMVTASHNPKDDNGYKVYWENGAQIISPIDQHISESISRNLKPWSDLLDYNNTEAIAKHPLIIDPINEIIDRYYSQITEKYCWHKDTNASSTLKLTYTAMHGVGAEWVRRSFEAFNLPPYIPTKEQVDPDPDFPTVAFPNPEEGKGALALAMKTAEREGSPIILANDPDADRLAVAERQPNGEWKILTGNEIGLLLGWWTWVNYKKQNPNADFSKAYMLASTVSSKILRAMAEKEGFRFEETLTGFKWMGNKAYELEQRGNTFLFAYEVEIGFLVGDISLDKDGVRSAAIFGEMSDQIYRNGLNLAQQLDQLYKQYGYYVMKTRYFFCYQPEVMVKIFDRLRKVNNGTYPSSIGTNGEFRIKHVRDLTVGFDSSQPDNKPTLPVDPSSQMITFTFEDGSVCTLRGSGTEPKLKYYVEVCDRESRERAVEKLERMTKAAIEEFLQPEQNGLIPPKD